MWARAGRPSNSHNRGDGVAHADCNLRNEHERHCKSRQFAEAMTVSRDIKAAIDRTWRPSPSIYDVRLPDGLASRTHPSQLGLGA